MAKPCAKGGPRGDKPAQQASLYCTLRCLLVVELYESSRGELARLLGELGATDARWRPPVLPPGFQAMSRLVFTAVLFAAAHSVEIEVITGPCTVDSEGCAMSPNYPSDYGSDESCTLAAPAVPLIVASFQTETDYDILYGACLEQHTRVCVTS